jgi:hypothetical protein
MSICVPIFHWTAPPVRAHVLLCMLAYHVEQHRRARLAPMLYAEVNHDAAAAMRTSVVARAERSNVCQALADNRSDRPRSAGTQRPEPARRARHQTTTALNEKYDFTLHTRLIPIQQRPFELLVIYPDRTQ